MTRKELRHSRWSHPVAGVAMPVADTGELAQVCRAVQLALDCDAVFTHVTAARLRGWWLPPSLETAPLIACTERGAPHHDRRGVYVRRCALPDSHRRQLDGVRIASAEWTLIELAEDLSLIDLVVAIDSALHLGDCTTESLSHALVPRRRGAKRLRRAISLADSRSESPWESILRLVHVLSGITDVRPQALIPDETGQIVARADLRIGHTRRLAEYDGEAHRNRDQHEKDLRREKLLARLGYERFGYTSVEIHHEVHRIVHDAEEALGLEYDGLRVMGWLEEYALSSLAPRGRSTLRRRMRRFARDTPPRRPDASA